MIWNNNDRKQFAERGISEEEIERQVELLKAGNQRLAIAGSCTVSHGILALDDVEMHRLASLYDSEKEALKIIRFTPASGAASRMFKHLLFPTDPGNAQNAEVFIGQLEQFAFYPLLEQILPKSVLQTKQDAPAIFEAVLDKNGLKYAFLPKALIDFHRYDREIRKAIDEQIAEATKYATSKGTIRFHFTISEQHEAWYKAHLDAVVPKYEKHYDVNIEIDYSCQNQATDTVALDESGDVFRAKNGQIIFRPGGHGALIGNLDALDADLIFLKNIDNISREELHPTIAVYKKLLAGKLLEIQKKIFKALRILEQDKVRSGQKEFIADLFKSELSITLSGNETPGELFKMLHKPIRVCGMVKNQGKAGGGPFWVTYNGLPTLQIVEAAQFAPDTEQQELLQTSTHFNPVDIVCATKDHHGKKYPLADFVDEGACFLSEKSMDGQKATILEHPGLWNGAMAHWITLFVEVPVTTFHPVKSVNDLLGKDHTYRKM